MSLLSELREDMRLARLNNPGYGFLFKMLDIAKGLLKLLVVAAFCLGIWHIIYDLGASDAANRTKQYAQALDQSHGTVVAAGVDAVQPEVAALTPERIAMLRQFAIRNRQSVADQTVVTDEGNANSQLSGESRIAKVQMPEAIIDQQDTRDSVESSAEIIVAGEIVPLPVDQTLPVIATPLELASNHVFETLEQKLRLPLESAAAVVETVDNVADQVVVEVVESKLESSDTVPASIEDNGGINEDAWILAQDSNRYTIQIGSTSNRPFLVRFSKLLPKGEPVSIYYYVSRNRPEYGLSFGLFDSKAAANSALEGLSQKVRRYGAFARKLSIVHQQIEQLSDQVSVARQ